MYQNYPYNYRYSNNNQDRIAGGFLGPFLLGGITGGLVAPFFYRFFEVLQITIINHIHILILLIIMVAITVNIHLL